MVVVRFASFGPYIICDGSKLEDEFGFSYGDTYNKFQATRLTKDCAISLKNYFKSCLNKELVIENV